MSSEIADICASNDPELVKFILFLKFFNPISLLTEERSLIGPLCFNNPSKVSNVKFRPLNLRYLCSRNIIILKV